MSNLENISEKCKNFIKDTIIHLFYTSSKQTALNKIFLKWSFFVAISMAKNKRK